VVVKALPGNSWRSRRTGDFPHSRRRVATRTVPEPIGRHDLERRARGWLLFGPAKPEPARCCCRMSTEMGAAGTRGPNGGVAGGMAGAVRLGADVGAEQATRCGGVSCFDAEPVLRCGTTLDPFADGFVTEPSRCP